MFALIITISALELIGIIALAIFVGFFMGLFLFAFGEAAKSADQFSEELYNRSHSNTVEP